MTSHRFTRVPYGELNSRQKESHNFHKVAAALADYGFNSIRITDDWESADFIAAHVDGSTFLKVQLKGRAGFEKKYMNKDLWIAFRDGEDTYVYPHDAALMEAIAAGMLVGTESWDKRGGYSFPGVGKKVGAILGKYKIAGPADD